MPELPEVETVRRGLAEVIGGATIASVVVTGRRSVRRQSTDEFTSRLIGRQIASVRRHGKYLLCDLDDGGVLVIHLRMSGKLVSAPHEAPLEPHTHVTIAVAGPNELRFVDPRTFGEMFVTDALIEPPSGVPTATAGADVGLPAELAHLGIDPHNSAIDALTLAQLIGQHRVAVKGFLLDQRYIAGIGNIYADEICFQAGVRPARRTNTLRRIDVKALADAVGAVISEAVRLGGSSLRDESYRDLFGSLGSYQHHHAVYARTDEPCISCGTPIKRIRVAGRSAHFCPSCQR